jgi:deoxyribose-phosphate aldolase
MSINFSSFIEHTNLKPTASLSEIDKLCLEASLENFVAVCIPPKYVANAKKMLDGSNVKVNTVIGFPLGFGTPEEKAQEIEDSLAKGADELDMVIDISALKSGDWQRLEAEIEACIKPVYEAGKVLKVIVESGILTSNELLECCALYRNYGIDFMKTSTGYSTKGATVEAVKIMRANLPFRVGIKASGGIKTYQFAKELIDAGAVRLGTSSGIQIMREYRELSSGILS